MRTVSDESIQDQAKQPDIMYINDVQLMDVADSLNYSHDDYVLLAHLAGRHVWDAAAYQSHRESIRAQTADYLAGCAEDSIIASHW